MRRRLQSSLLFWPKAFGPSLTALLLAASAVTAQTTFTVNATDDADDGACDATHCSLREAITAANQLEGEKLIAFDIAGPPPHTIRPTSGLPSIEDGVTLDGTTEPDFAGTPVIELDGSDAGMAHGLSIVLSNNTIRGLVVNRFGVNGIAVETDASANVVEGCYIGTDVTGSVALGNGNAGVLIGQARDNTVGGPTAAQRNVISGNIEGVTIVDVTATGNRVIGNYIGTNASGDASIPNDVGVLLLAPDNTVGGTTAGEGNVISGNVFNGVDLGPPNANGNVVVGNYIGLDATGSAAVGNDVGVWISDVADNTIGGTDAGARNVISGNREGVTLWEAGATRNQVLGNYVGTNAAGTAAVANTVGVVVYGPGNTVGGSAGGAGNLLSGNTETGLTIFGNGASDNVVVGNYIGTDARGTAGLGNGTNGVNVIDASSNTIGGTTAAQRNVISGNADVGVLFLGAAASGNVLEGNYIGTDVTGSAAIPNHSGVLLFSPDNTIGGATVGAGNVISGNAFAGIDLGEDTRGTVIQGNYIGTDATGTVGLGNDLGVFVNHAPENTIGGTAIGAGNVISGNTGDAIHLNGPKATGNVVQGNYIGTNAARATDVGNGGTAIAVFAGASDNVIGGAETGAGNVIAHNGWKGVVLEPDAGTGNAIRSNAIFGNARLAIDLGNDGTTANDLGDADTGPNDYQNYPVLSAVRTAAGASVTAELDGRPGGTYTIEVFSNDICRRSGTGDGAVLGGTATLTTDATGNGSVDMTITDLSGGAVLAATATDADGNTSELGTCTELSDFAVAVAPSTRTVTAGQSTTYTVTVSALGESFDDAVTLSCSGLPSGAQCSFSESELNPGIGEAVSTLTVSTTAPSSAVLAASALETGSAETPHRGQGSSSSLLWIVGFAVMLSAAGLLERKRPGGLARVRLLMGGLVLALILQIACGDDGTEPLPPTGGTPTGTYELTVSGAAGTLVHNATTDLVVQ